MARLRAKISVYAEYEANPDHYGTSDPSEMATLDLNAAEDDIHLFLDGLSDNAEWIIEVEPV